MPTQLIVTVDTEEEGLWNGALKTRGNTVRNVGGTRRFQQLCDRYLITPTYLVDTPVVDDDRSRDLLKGFQDEGRCEIGAHLHPWCAPPLDEEINDRNSYMCNLPEPLQREKLTRLTDHVEERFGRRPTSFRAGRYGLDIVGARILKELGYVVDSSVIGFSNYSDQGGPDFEDTPSVPYRVGGDDLRVPCEGGRLLEVPVAVGFNRVRFSRAHRLRQCAASRWLRPLRLVGILDRLGIVQRIKFSPEQANAARMKRLADVFVARGAPCIVLMLHSSSLVPGCSPYVPDAARLEECYADLESVFEHCLTKHSMTGRTLTQFAQNYDDANS